MVSTNTIEETASGLNHIHFFIDQYGSTEHHSRSSSRGSNTTETSATASSSSSSSRLNPLAASFEPGSTNAVGPPPSASQMFELRATADKGLGLFATTFIERGTLVISEEPLLKIPGHEAYLVWGPYSRLGNAEKAAYDSLHSFEADYLNFDQASRTRLVDYTDDNLDEEDIDEMVTDHCRVMAIFATNNFLIPPSELGIFVTASRLNHSCVPNVHHSYNPTLKSATVYAIRDIEPNEELLTSYIVCEDTYLVSAERIERLRKSHGFICTCPACTDPIGTSNARRQYMASIAWGLSLYRQCKIQPQTEFTPITSAAALFQAESLVNVMLEEGIVNMELAKAYRMASENALEVKNYEKALEYARDEAEVERNCLGGEIRDMRKLGVAAERWTDKIFEVIKAELGDGAVSRYRSLNKREKKKRHAKNWDRKKQDRGRGGRKRGGAHAGRRENVA